MKTIILFIAFSVNVFAQGAQMIYYYGGTSYRRSGQGELGTDSTFTASASVTSSGNIASKPNMHFGANGLIYKSTDTTGGGSTVYDTVGITIDGGGSAITTGSKGFRRIEQTSTITGWTIISKESGSCVIDVKKGAYSAIPTTSSIAGTEKPTLSSAQKNQDLTLSTWTTSLSSDDVLEFVVDSASTVTRVTVFIHLTKG